ncbi:MAG TPA: hypothetical protein VL737_04825 [Candidatus Pristimantibacillus sp.]|nr:hypothetical protein [Candidatus Pristimantibacillus sp.]
MTGRHAAAAEASDRSASPLYISKAYLESVLSNEEWREAWVTLAPDPVRTVVWSLAGTYMMGPYPTKFDRETWTECVGLNAGDLTLLSETQAKLVLDIGVASGLLDYSREEDVYAFPSEEMRLALLGLYHVVVNPYLKWHGQGI